MEKQIRATIYCSVSTKEQAEPLQKELIQTAAVKAEINGLTPDFDCCARPAEWVDKTDNPILCLSAVKFIFGAVRSLIIEMGGKAILGLSRLDYSSHQQRWARLSTVAL